MSLGKNRIIEFIADIGLSVIKDKIVDFKNKTSARNRLSAYLEKQNVRNFDAAFDEEIDFGGISDYIQNNLNDDLNQYFWGESEEREKVKTRIIEHCLIFASAGTNASEARIKQLVENAIDILADYYREKIDKDLIYVTNEIEGICVSENKKTRVQIYDSADYLASVFLENGYAIQKSSETDIRIDTYRDTIDFIRKSVKYSNITNCRDSDINAVRRLSEDISMLYNKIFPMLSLMLSDDEMFEFNRLRNDAIKGKFEMSAAVLQVVQLLKNKIFD